MHQLSLHNTLFQNFGVKNFESIFTGGFIMDPPKQDIRKNLLRRILKNVVSGTGVGGVRWEGHDVIVIVDAFLTVLF